MGSVDSRSCFLANTPQILRWLFSGGKITVTFLLQFCAPGFPEETRQVILSKEDNNAVADGEPVIAIDAD